MLNFVLLDDDPNHNDTLEKALKSACETENIEGRVLLKATQAKEVTYSASSFPDRSIYFIDIVLTNEHLPGRDSSSVINGLDVSKLISESSNHPNYTFISPHTANTA